ncbi:MAG: hypothetical protein M3209_17610 [Acidobacteriota bacterium]|nr:hypothetical protein [Acidobacteriota bacterium]
MDISQEHEISLTESEEYFCCAECCKEKETEEARMLSGGGAVCEDCAEEQNFVSCDYCLYYFRFDELLLTCKGCVSVNKQNIPFAEGKDKKFIRKIKSDDEQTEFLVTMQIRVSSVSSAEELKRKLVAVLYDEDENRLVPEGATPELEVLDYLEIEITEEEANDDQSGKEKQTDER